MKKRIFIILTVIACTITGCVSSVSQEEYDAKVNELETMQKDYDAKIKELETMQEEYDAKTNELESVQKELSDLKVQGVENELAKAGAFAWVETAFGEKAQAIINANDLYVNIPTGYTVSQESIADLWNNIISATVLYASYYKINPEQLPYDTVTIIVLNEKTGENMFSVQFIKASDGTFEQNSFMVNMKDSLTIISYLNNLISN